MKRLVLALALVASLLAGTAPAAADQEPTVAWNERWPRVRLLEGLNIIALTGASLAINAAPYHTESAWKGPILFDRPAQKFFRLPSANSQDAIATLSDRLYQGMVLAPYVFDVYFSALAIHENADVAVQMLLINMQSLGLSGVVALGAQHAVGRARPYVDECPPGGVGPTKTGFNTCGGFPDNQSFFSGHAAAAFTMAGLTCLHHQHLPLWGGGAPDVLACTTMLALAGTTGIARVMADRHWMSDVILGTAVGLFNGYLVPYWLHYGVGKGKISTSVETKLGRIAPIPQLFEGGAGLGVAVF